MKRVKVGVVLPNLLTVIDAPAKGTGRVAGSRKSDAEPQQEYVGSA